MFVIRHALGWGLFLLAIAPALAQSADDSETQLHPFHEVVVASFDDVWREATPGTQRTSGAVQHPIEWVTAEELVTPREGEAAAPTATLISDLPRLLPTPTAQPLAKLPPMLSALDPMRDFETGLFQWFVGMLGVVGLVALGGVIWIYQVRPALDVRQTTGRLRLSSALSLPRRSGLFLVDVEDQTVLVAIDAGGIRHVVPLGVSACVKTTARRTAADKAPRTSLPSPPEGVPALEAVAFHDVYQEQQALGDVEAILTAAKFSTRPQTAPAHANTAS
jgi:flagellar biogenesis protein FliO